MQIVNFFFNDTATTEIYTLSLHDALPILVLQARTWMEAGEVHLAGGNQEVPVDHVHNARSEETRLNSSHVRISYAVFCLKKKSAPYTRRAPGRPAPGSHDP